MGQRETVLTMLEEAAGNGVSSNQFYAACLPRFSARIHELRNAGHTITKEPVEDGHWLYRLVGGEGCETSASRVATPPSGQSPERAPATGLTQVARVAGESSTTLGDRSSSPEPREAAVAEPRQVSDADGSRGHGPSASLLLFDMPVADHRDAA